MALIRQRKLTKQQIRRIKKQQATSQYDTNELIDGVVMAHYGKQLEVKVTGLPPTLPDYLLNPPEVAEDELEPFWQAVKLGDIWRCHSRTNLPMLATGDKVRWLADPNTGFGRIEVLHERTSLITRPDRYHKIKPVVANVDILAIMFAPLPSPAYSLIDRYLVVAHHANVTPLLILNKADLLDDEQHKHAKTLLEDYQKLGYDSLITSCMATSCMDTTQGYQALQQELQQELQQKIAGKLVVFVGQSGVGKSSLVNQMLPSSEQSVNVISSNSQLGQHTTTTSRLLPFVEDDHAIVQGGIVDTPGIREYGIWHLSPTDIIKGFVELEPLAEHCKFRDCKHTHNTKGCALRQAVADGEVLERRLESLVLLQDEADTLHY